MHYTRCRRDNRDRLYYLKHCLRPLIGVYRRPPQAYYNNSISWFLPVAAILYRKVLPLIKLEPVVAYNIDKIQTCVEPASSLNNDDLRRYFEWKTKDTNT